MKNIALIILMSIAANGTSAELPDVSGMWVGSYSVGGSVVECTMVIEQSRKIVKARMIEVQTFGEEPSVGLTADVVGVINESGIYLVKTYDGSGGQVHSVAYELQLSPDRQVMNGTWSLGEGGSGASKFSRYRASVANDF